MANPANRCPNVCFWHKADMLNALTNVCFWGQSGHGAESSVVGAGVITIGFSFLFGTKNTVAQAVMTAGLAMTIALVLLSIVAMEQPFAGLARIEPEAFNQIKDIFDTWSNTGAG
jgi:hypothetical protein